MSRLVFLTLAYEDEKEILKLSQSGLQSAANTYQHSLLRGINADGRAEVLVVNCLPVGSWPRQFKKLLIPTIEHTLETRKCIDVGCINLPVIKQLTRYFIIKRTLKRIICKDDEILIYSSYLPYLKVASKFKKNNSTIIITDLPEYYDLQRTSYTRSVIRQIYNKRVYRYIAGINRFVLLTDCMKKPLNIENRPYTVVEGICDTRNAEDDIVPKKTQKKIIFYSGTLVKKFGISELVNSVRLIDDPGVELWICGRGEGAFEIEEAAKADNRIKYLGFCTKEQVNSFRQQATVLVNPRRNEGEYTKYSFPSKTMEYMMSGIPVVMYHLDGIPPEYEKYIFLVDEKVENGLKISLEKVLYMSDEERKSIGLRAQEFVMKEKNEVYQAQKVLDLIFGGTKC